MGLLKTAMTTTALVGALVGSGYSAAAAPEAPADKASDTPLTEGNPADVLARIQRIAAIEAKGLDLFRGVSENVASASIIIMGLGPSYQSCDVLSKSFNRFNEMDRYLGEINRLSGELAMRPAEMVKEIDEGRAKVVKDITDLSAGAKKACDMKFGA